MGQPQTDRVYSGHICLLARRKRPFLRHLQHFLRLARPMLKGGMMKVAAKQEDPKALDYFTTTITPVHTLRAAAVLTLKHAVLLVGFTAVVMALVRLVLAD